MNITELDSYNLADAVKFHNRLNPKIWGRDEHLLPEVRQKLLEIAADFQEFLGIDDLAVEDITVSGSNAAYSYTPHSDIDLHLVVRMPQDDEVYQELFNAKKYQYNDLMDIKIHGADVELYVQPADEAPVSLGEYSIKNNDWIQVPRKKRAKIDHSVVRHKYEDVKSRIESALKENDSDRVQALIDKIKAMRQSGLDAHGEFGAENLAFKMLRSQGYIKKLYDHRAATRARELSLREQNKPKTFFRWGFGSQPAQSDAEPEDQTYKNYFKPTDAQGADSTDLVFKNPKEYEWWLAQRRKDKVPEGHQGHPYSSEDGVAPTTAMFVTEDDSPESIVQDFIRDTAKRLGIENMPRVELHHNDDWSVAHHSFGMYEPESHTLHVNLNDRHILDILRTTAHELAHCRQNELNPLPDDAGKTGSPWEDEAHAVAGEIMRDYADANPEMFSENASGYIPKNKREAQDPRYKMAVTVDVKPGEVGRQANKLALKTGKNGEPTLLMKSANLLEYKLPQPSKGQGKFQDLNEPLGPEFKPTMPRGTVRVDVSDVYDWYKLGKHISNLDQADASEFGKGPPSTIVSFGDEDTEHKYIKGLEKLGLTTTDIDPVDPKKPQGMKRQKVDPTYNVAEAANSGPHIVYATGPRTQGVNDVDLVFKDLRTNRIVAHVIGNNSSLAEFAPPSGGGDGGGRLPDRGATYEIRMGNAAKPTYVAVGDPQQDREHRVYKLGPAQPGAPEYYGHGLTLVSELDWWSFLEKMLGEIMWEDDAIEAGHVDRLDNGDLVFTKQQGVTEQNNLAESLRQEFKLFEEQDLFEITMSPSNLKKEAAKTGALAGMEFEMIVPNVQGDPGDFESEPDYDHDERCRSIEDACQFFYDGDFNGRRDIERLREKMNEDYLEWLDSKIEEEWDNDSEEYIQEWVAHNVDEDEWNPDGLEGSDRQEALEEFATNVHADPGSDYYQQALDEFREEHREDYDESDWLDAEDLDRMSDIENAYNINWPYYTEPGDEYGQAEISDVAQDFENAIGRDTYAADSYHSSSTLRPSPERLRYVVEPDGSLEGDNPGDRGLEFVSPPLPIDEILSDLKKVKAWAGEYGCYTNDSTGLHINISVPNYSRENLDFVKLALLMGDKYVLDAFGRTSNTYAKSALGIINDAVRNKPEDAARLLDKMKSNLDQLATKAIHSGVTSKYTSINTKDGHIEFRSPGGDWLDENFDKIENTLLRFTVAMSAALNPEMYREEYLKKLYKLLTQDQKGSDTIKYFSEYVAGKIPRAALRSFVKQAQLERRLKRDPTGGQQYWWRVSNPPHSHGEIEVVATTREEAIEKALAPDGYPSWSRTRASIQAVPVRPYDASPLKATVGEPQAIGQSSGATLNGRPSNPDGGWVISPENDRSRVAYRFAAASFDDANIVRRQWAADNPGVWIVQRDTNRTLGQPQSASRTSEGNWGIWMRDANRFSRAPGQIDNSVLRRFPSREAAEQFIAQARENNPNMRTDIEVREIEPAGGFVNALSQTDIENRLGWPDQTGDANYEVVDRRTMTPVFKFVANTDQDAARKYSQYLDVMMLPHDTEDYGFREIALPGSTIDLQRQRAAQAQQNQQTWNIVNRNTGEVAGTFTGTEHQAEDHALNTFGHRFIYDVVPAQQQQPAPRPLGAGRELRGWKIVDPNGNTLHEFGGVGNVQADANTYAMGWLRRNPEHMQTGVEVVPNWVEA